MGAVRRVVAACLAACVLAPAASGGVFVDRAVKAFRSGQHVYVDPGARNVLPPKDARFLRSHIDFTGGPVFYAAILPPFAAREANGPLRLLPDAIGRALDCTCTVAVAVGGRYAALSSGVPHGKDRELLAQSIAKHRKDGVLVVLEDYDTRVAKQVDQEQSGGSAGIAVGVGLSAFVAVALLALVLYRRRQWRDLALARGTTAAELAALGRELPDEPAARAAFERAERELALARKPADLERVRRALREARG